MSTYQRINENSNNQHCLSEEDHGGKDSHLKISKHKEQQQFGVMGRHSGPISNQSTLHYSLPQSFWLIVEIESDNELNSYALVESKDIVGLHSIDSLTTGKLIVVNIDDFQKKATVVMASSEYI
jgi:hypothetical protein